MEGETLLDFGCRLKSLIAHAVISALLVLPITWLVYRVWYPDNTAALLGVSFILGLLAVFSIGIWPFLTALVIKSDKKEQRRDHLILWAVQAVFTVITLYVLFMSRVVWVVYTADLFEIIRQKDIVYVEDEPLKAEYRVGMLSPFIWVGASFSDNEAIAQKQRTEDLDGISIARRAEALLPLAEKHRLMQRYARPLAQLRQYNDDDVLSDVRKQYPKASLWLPVKGFVRDAVVLTDNDFSFFQVVLLNPWEDDKASSENPSAQ
jgi:hypothetical protein